LEAYGSRGKMIEMSVFPLKLLSRAQDRKTKPKEKSVAKTLGNLAELLTISWK
jgi:hypothetical protein